VVLEDVLHFSNWLLDFLISLLFLCFYPISSTSLLSNNIPVDQRSFWGSNNFWDQTTTATIQGKNQLKSAYKFAELLSAWPLHIGRVVDHLHVFFIVTNWCSIDNEV
jgi:hypothetical protein